MDVAPDERWFCRPAAACIRGDGDAPPPGGLSDVECCAWGHQQGLALHRFKRTMGLPRVRRVLGLLRGFRPADLVDLGTGRGVFLWPLVDAFPNLPVVAVDHAPARVSMLEQTRRGGLPQLQAVAAELDALPFASDSADIVTALEVLEHQERPLPAAREALRVARRGVVVSVPSHADDNPEHVQLFTPATLTALLQQAGADRVSIETVRGHFIAWARVAR